MTTKEKNKFNLLLDVNFDWDEVNLEQVVEAWIDANDYGYGCSRDEFAEQVDTVIRDLESILSQHERHRG